MMVLSKINPVTYGVDAVRHILLAKELATLPTIPGQFNAPTLIGVSVFGHITTTLEDILVVVVIGMVLLSLAVWQFNQQE